VRLGVSAALVGGRLVLGDVELTGGAVSACGLPSPGGRGIAAPGFVDLQVNGFAGVDLLGADAAGYARAGEALLATGVTAYLPTFITAPADVLLEALRGVPAAAPVFGRMGARILGVHLEGPFLSPGRLGAHPPGHRRDPDPALLERLLAAGPVRLVTLAPELPGSGPLLDLLAARGVVASLGHTDARAADANAAFDRGVRSVTHLFNAMRPFGHRDPGLAGAALARDGVVVHLIADGVHVAPEAMLTAWRAARGRVALVTDAIAGAGLGDGTYALGGVEVEVRDGVARRTGGVLAGSVLTLDAAVRNVVALGVPLEEALAAASTVPAGLLGLPAGGLEPGAPADVVVLDDQLEVERVLVGGKPAL
jgi:N-acetylglucosamine-6-phosphate deacetylase